ADFLGSQNHRAGGNGINAAPGEEQGQYGESEKQLTDEAHSTGAAGKVFVESLNTPDRDVAVNACDAADQQFGRVGVGGAHSHDKGSCQLLGERYVHRRFASVLLEGRAM